MVEVNFRLLEPHEYVLLESHPFLNGIIPTPDLSRVTIAETAEGQIVGFHVLTLAPHLEPIWIDPAFRNSTVAGRLWKHTLKVLDDLRIKVAYVFSVRPDTDDYLTRLGLSQLPYKIFLHDPEGIYPKDDMNKGEV